MARTHNGEKFGPLENGNLRKIIFIGSVCAAATAILVFYGQIEKLTPWGVTRHVDVVEARVGTLESQFNELRVSQRDQAFIQWQMAIIEIAPKGSEMERRAREKLRGMVMAGVNR